MPQLHRASPACWLISLLALGCSGDELPRLIVHGTVTFAGKPVEKGQIRFVPQPGTPGPITIDSIDGGQYTTASAGGVPLGTHRVEIKGYDAKEYATAPTGPGSPPVKQRLPDKYNSQSELSVTLHEDSPEQLDFDLQP